MKRPDYTFRHFVSPVYYVHGCAEQLAQESRGVFGCHSFENCPDCIRTFAGWEFWGENGHLQATAKTRAQLIGILQRKAKDIRIASGKDPAYQPQGATIGNSFTRRSAIYYRG